MAYALICSKAMSIYTYCSVLNLQNSFFNKFLNKIYLWSFQATLHSKPSLLLYGKTLILCQYFCFQPMLSIYVSWKYQLTFSNPSLFLFIHYKYCHSISLSSLPLKEFFVCMYLGVFRSVFAMTSECVCGCMCACVVCAHVCQRADFRIHLIPSTVSSREQTQVTRLE